MLNKAFFSVCQDGDLRQALLQWKITDDIQQHERLHDQNRLSADHLHVQRRLPQGVGGNVSSALTVSAKLSDNERLC